MTLSRHEAKTYASAFELCSLSFGYPTEELAQAVMDGEWVLAAEEIAREAGLPLPQGFAAHVQDMTRGWKGSEEALHALRAEYTRLFIGSPKAVIPPYESMWIGNKSSGETLLFVNPCALALERFAKACRLKRAEDAAREPFDHVMIEAQLAEYLLMCIAEDVDPEALGIEVADLPDESLEGALADLIDEHLSVWVSRFADAVSEGSRLPFYQAVAIFLRQIVEKCGI